MPQYMTHANLRLTAHGLFAIGGAGSGRAPAEIADFASLILLETFVHDTDPELAFDRFCARASAVDAGVKPLSEEFHARETIEVSLGRNIFIARDPQTGALVDLIARSRTSRSTLADIVETHVQIADKQLTPDRETFDRSMQHLCEIGLLTPAAHQLDWGTMRRRFAICEWFGFSRGAPVDRYYLDRFVAEIRERVVGEVLEIGGRSANRELYGFPNVTRYQTLDMRPGPGVDIVGDAHDPAIHPPDSVDSIVAFNVLEHCEQPWKVVENMRLWLRRGGWAFCMVPNAQRIHAMPRDYWRALPEAVQWMFRDFSTREIRQYGNPTTVIAAYLGIAAEELSRDELDEIHLDYPVATCISARA